MTVGTRMHKTLAGIESAKADFEMFAGETEDAQAKSEFYQYAQQLEGICQNFKQRVNYVEQQEPQYKVKEQAQQKAQMQQQQQQQQQSKQQSPEMH